MSQHPPPSQFEMAISGNHVILDSDSDDDDGMGQFDDMINSATEQRVALANSKLSLLCCCASTSESYRRFSSPESSNALYRRRKFALYSFVTLALIMLVTIIVLASALVSSPPPSSSLTPATPPSVEDLKAKSYLPPAHRNGVVASDNALCSEMGMGVMRDFYGNAVDAAVTTALCLGVVSMASSGIGGGGFILVHSAENKKNTFVDGREFAPGAATPTMFSGLDERASVDGALAIAVPGELKGLQAIHGGVGGGVGGRLSWSACVEPVRDLARDGFIVSSFLEDITRKQWDKILKNDALAAVLTRPGVGGGHIVEGDLLKRPKLAQTLTRIMEEGADALYTGSLAETLSAEIISAGGIITPQDLAAYEPTVRSPINATVNGYTILGAPPPSSGGATVIAAARYIAGFEEGYAANLDTLSKHRLSEAMKHAFAMRMNLADPAFYDEVNDVVEDMIAGDYVEGLRRNYHSDDSVQDSGNYGGDKWAQLSEGGDGGGGGGRKLRKLTGLNYLEDHGTAHLSVIDSDQNCVALTTTVNTEFGSGFLSPSTGILLNNQMDDFASEGRPNYFGLAPSPLNYPEPFKRPLSSMSPSIVLYKGVPRMVLGASGGPKIITATLQTFLNHALAGQGERRKREGGGEH
ncbi:hypothetical protein TL16_g09409 [Triparma laevis f. inornata]|uniref:Uncharacterized protein n=1 Tax=Triparma laevis f. inornata TaxID=1714386 RepID=A0A9W7BB18_9STRA|nr:hypothetical protein TL16_g09409 [Triparma laevis f. inornata]